LDARAITITVFNTPLDKIYPAENKDLAHQILDKGGAWLSELPLKKKGHRSSFVQRDRIQSGLCVAVIPVQTGVEGGTMHTVSFAERQERLLFCPRPLDAESNAKQYEGINQLIVTGRAKAFQAGTYPTVLREICEHRDSLMSRPSKNSLPPVTAPAQAGSFAFIEAEQPDYKDDIAIDSELVEVLAQKSASAGLNNRPLFEEFVTALRNSLFSISQPRKG